ncbi:MAG TPA: hypothetical protein VK966_08460 [Longimicrobiales bacterium]|nr:hypothetical protein [Longimicrobiales bacterium]
MTHSQNHPDRERLQAFVENDLDRTSDPRLAAHIAVCSRCRGEVEEFEALFEGLSSLGHFAPAAGFVDRVMAQVRVRTPWPVRIMDWLEQFAPRTTRGWAVAAAFLALPIIGASLLTWWLVSRPGVTPQGLLLIAGEYTTHSLAVAWEWTWLRFSESNLAVWMVEIADQAARVGGGGLGLAAILFGALTAASVWVLYQNLFRSEARRTDYASYVF